MLPGLCAARISARTAPEEPTLEEWIAAQHTCSTVHLLRNISPAKPVTKRIMTRNIAAARWPYVRRQPTVHIEEPYFVQKIVAHRGAVTAAAPGKPGEPDYYFHWVRDSSLVMRALAHHEAWRGAHGHARRAQLLGDFVGFTRALQHTAAEVGLGEPRFNMDGLLDFLKWSRPQYDGPALRAMCLQEWRSADPGSSFAAAGDLERATRTDLDYVAGNWMRDGFDLWEEYKGHDYHARVVQYAAMLQGGRIAASTGDKKRERRYAEVASQLFDALETHWLPDKGYYGFFVGPKTYWDGTKHDKPGDNLDVGVLIGAVHANLPAGRHSVLDDRILATAVKLEDLFADIYPVNRTRAADEGLLYGRYAGDTYYGGNPWVMLTFEVASLYYLAAIRAAQAGMLPVTALNQEFLQRALRRGGSSRSLVIGEDALARQVSRRQILEGFVACGDAILRRIWRLHSEPGDLPEQLDKHTGVPVSSKDLSWSHAAFLEAVTARLRTPRILAEMAA